MTEVLINADDLDRVLACPISYENEQVTIRDYLYALLRTVWHEEQGFDGKRPFGSSGWKLDLVYALASAGFVSAVIDEDGYIESISDEEKQKGYSLIESAIAHVFYGKQ